MIKYNDGYENDLATMAKQLQDVRVYLDMAKELEVRAKRVVSILEVASELRSNTMDALRPMTILGTVEACVRFCATVVGEVEDYLRTYNDSVVEFTVASKIRGCQPVADKALKEMSDSRASSAARHEEAGVCYQMMLGFDSRIFSLERQFVS